MSKVITLLAEILYVGKGCPVCGGHKTEPARTCRSCFEDIGFAATRSVDSVAFSYAQAVIGHHAALLTELAYNREIVWAPVLCQVTIDEYATHETPEPETGIEPFWDCQISLEKGYLPMYVFGGGQAGEKVTVLLEKKFKSTKKGVYAYLRGQILKDGIISNVKLEVRQYGFNSGFVEGLPNENEKQDRRSWSIGFVPDTDETVVTMPIPIQEVNQACA